MKHLPPFILIASLILASCAPGSGVEEIPPTPSITATETAAPSPTFTPSATATPQPLTAEDFNAELSTHQAEIERDLGVKVVSFHDYGGGNGVAAGIYGWDENGIAVVRFSSTSRSFESFDRMVYRAYRSGDFSSSEIKKAAEVFDRNQIKFLTDEEGRQIPPGYLFTVNSEEDTRNIPIIYIACVLTHELKTINNPNVSFIVCEAGDAYKGIQLMMGVQRLTGDMERYNKKLPHGYLVPESGVVKLDFEKIGSAQVFSMTTDVLNKDTPLSISANEQYEIFTNSKSLGQMFIIGIQPNANPSGSEHVDAFNQKVLALQEALRSGVMRNFDIPVNIARLWVPENLLPTTVDH